MALPLYKHHLIKSGLHLHTAGIQRMSSDPTPLARLPWARAKADLLAPVLSPSERLRRDGRSTDAFRTLVLRTGVMAKAAGSAHLELANTKVVCSVLGPHAAEGRGYQEHGVLDCSLRFTSFAHRERRIAPHGGPSTGGGSTAPSTDERALSLSLAAALSGSVQLSEYPKSVISVNVLVLEDDGAALAAAITCASLALADASVLIYGLVPACNCVLLPAGGDEAPAGGDEGGAGVGIDKGGAVILDPCADELRSASATTTVAHMPSLQQLMLHEHEGAASVEKVNEALVLSLEGCSKMHAQMEEVLHAKIHAMVRRGQLGQIPKAQLEQAPGARTGSATTNGVDAGEGAVAAKRPHGASEVEAGKSKAPRGGKSPRKK